MRIVGALLLVFLSGCSTQLSRTKALVFDIRSRDVLIASAETLATPQSLANAAGPDFEAQIHIVFNEDAAKRFQHFTKTYAGSVFELQINGEVLLPAVSAWPAGGSEVRWFTRSLDDAKRFAASLNTQ